MFNHSTRRMFLAGLAAGAGTSWIASLARAAERQTDPPTAADELRRRAQAFVAQRRLLVDYYRIGRKLAYPLPVKNLSLPDVPVPGIPQYPWATWLTWAMEERIVTLGWVAEWFADHAARQAARADLAALAEWPEYRQYPTPDLSSAHAGRILWTATTHWRWIDPALREKLLAACRRHVDSLAPPSDKLFAGLETKADMLRRPNPSATLHNIALIGTLGAALTATVADHPARGRLNARLLALFEALLELRAQGLSEGAAYDGYVLDFAADWLATLPEAARRPVLDHPRFKDYLDQSYMLGAPGALERVAELGDVEPREMPFHLSAQAKLLGLRPEPVARWLLRQCPAAWLRADALAALHRLPAELPEQEPPAGALDAHYAAVLRSGWQPDDLAVAVACSNSPMGHLHFDNGSLVLGTSGQWLITDPGYQQYAKGAEREFTVGPTAHNAPVVNGVAQSQRRPRRLALADLGAGLRRVSIDLADCYPAALGLKTAIRHVWLADKNLCVVADQLSAGAGLKVAYHWHGHRDGAWWVDDGWALLALADRQLWITCPQHKLGGAHLQRLPGSRGQLTLTVALDSPPPVIWWVFALGDQRPPVETTPDGLRLQVPGQAFAI
jgi:hypothetical protein